MKLLIFYLTDSRRHYTFEHFVNMINKSQRKDQWKLLILTHSNDEFFYADKLSETSIEFDSYNVDSHDNYLKKVFTATDYAKNNNFKYMMKCDNDIFIKHQTLDYMVDNLELLDDNKHLTIGPVLTSGIPGIEFFIDQFLDPNAKDIIEKKFLKTIFYDRDGASYKFLNKHTIGSTIWNKDDFFDSIRNMNHHYKGLHPIRINEDALQYLNEYIIENKERFLLDNQLSVIETDKSPYLCNSIFCIKTDTYNKIIKDRTLYVDPFDEVPLNKYCWLNNMNHLFVANGFAIHMYYNWKPHYLGSEVDFCNRFFS
jgi:hypothetical protein